jgi:ABC-type multidrug transport system fused ATPase/permease subunit
LLKDKKNMTKGILNRAENKESGTVPWPIWKWWFTMAGCCGNVMNFTLHILIQTSTVLGDWWIGIWASGTYGMSLWGYVLVFAGFALGNLVFTGVRYWVYGVQVSGIALKIYGKVVKNLLGRPMEFFDTTPIGQILNRCGKDIENSDIMFPFTFTGLVNSVFVLLGTLIITSIIMPVMLIVIFIAAIGLSFMTRRYIKTSIELRRLSLITNSPVLSTCTEAVNGLVVLRGAGKVDYFMRNWVDRCNADTTVLAHEQFCSKWMELYLEFGVATLVSCVVFIIP